MYFLLLGVACFWFQDYMAWRDASLQRRGEKW